MNKYELRVRVLPDGVEQDGNTFVRFGLKNNQLLPAIEIQRLREVRERLTKKILLGDLLGYLAQDKPTPSGVTCASFGITAQEAESAYLLEYALEATKQLNPKGWGLDPESREALKVIGTEILSRDKRE